MAKYTNEQITLSIDFPYDKDKYEKIKRIFEKENQDIEFASLKKLTPQEVLDEFCGTSNIEKIGGDFYETK